MDWARKRGFRALDRAVSDEKTRARRILVAHFGRGEEFWIEKPGIDAEAFPSASPRKPVGEAAAVRTAVKIDMPAVPGIGVGWAFALDHHIGNGIIGPKHAIAAAQGAIAMGDFRGCLGQPDRHRAAMAGCKKVL